MIRKKVTIKYMGSYSSLSRNFEDEKHFSNWYFKTSGQGKKIIGTWDLPSPEPIIEPGKQLTLKI